MNPKPEGRVLTTVALILGLVAMLALPIPAEPHREMSEGAELALSKLALFVAGITEFIAILIIAAGVFRASFRCIRRRKQSGGATEVRVGLARALALALEFTIASDILQTVVAPSRQALATLTIVVLLRTLITHFLGEELREEAEKPAEETAP